MKNIIIILLSLIYSPMAFSQQDIFAGIWKYQNGNEVFIVNIWKVTDGYKGHYKKIIVDAGGNQVSEVYNSDKPIGTSTTNWPYTISAGTISQNGLRGGVYDNTVINTPNAGGFIEGWVNIDIINPACFTPPTNACPLQAQWTVKRPPGLYPSSEPPYSVPTNIILTKQ